MRFALFSIGLALAFCVCRPKLLSQATAPNLQTSVLVVGGGTGGTAAAIQCARLGVPTLLVEPTPWLGGMLSAAGVSATDGNHRLPSGLWAEFRAAIYRHYGSPEAVNTGWVSNTHFEPHVADSILKAMCRRERSLTVLYGFDFQEVLKNENRVAGAIFKNANGETRRVEADITIDATELGDLLAKAGAAYDLGMDARAATGESSAPNKPQPHIQDLTWAVVVRDFGPGADKTIAPPPGYDPAEFACCCADRCPRAAKLHTCEKMLSYARLPRQKILLNWPIHGNDVYLNIVESKPAEREKRLQKAKNQSLGFLYYLQTELGYRHLGLADDEFPSADRLPLIPYQREGRRLRGLVRLVVSELSNPGALSRTGISVGDYPLDHHHKKLPQAEALEGDFPAIPSFSVPLGALVPASVEGLVVCEKGISVSHVVNGATRLQPCVLLTGQAAGALAAHCVLEKKQPRQAKIRAVQRILLQNKAFLMPYLDVAPDEPTWTAVQRIGAAGLLRGRGEPYQWANRTWFDPDSTAHNLDLLAGLQALQPGFYANVRLRPGHLSIGDALAMLDDFLKNDAHASAFSNQAKAAPGVFLKNWTAQNWSETLGLANFDPKRRIARRELAVVLDAVLEPFDREIDWEGHYK